MIKLQTENIFFQKKSMEYNSTWKNSKKDDLVLDYQY